MLSAYKAMADVLGKVNTLPSNIRGLVTAVIGFAAGIIRTMLVLLIVNLAIEVVGILIKNSMVGKAIVLLRQSRIMMAAKNVIDACTRKYQICKALPKILPKLPCLVDVAQTGLDLMHTVNAGALTWETAGSQTANALATVQDCRTPRPDGARGGSCSANSFTGETRVLMADGAHRPIAEVEVGDAVWAADPETGDAEPRTVIATIAGRGLKHLVALTIATALGLATVTATDGHPFWVESEQAWVDAGELQPGDRLSTADEGAIPVVAVTETTEQATVFNLTVDELHTYFVAVGREEILVHNANSCGGADPGIKGKQGVEKSIANAKAKGHTILAKEVSIDADLGNGYIERVRVDLVAMTPGGEKYFIDAKYGKRAGLTKNQRVAYENIPIRGGLVVGNNGKDAGLPDGTRIGPTRVQIDEWED